MLKQLDGELDSEYKWRLDRSRPREGESLADFDRRTNAFCTEPPLREKQLRLRTCQNRLKAAVKLIDDWKAEEQANHVRSGVLALIKEAEEALR